VEGSKKYGCCIKRVLRDIKHGGEPPSCRVCSTITSLFHLARSIAFISARQKSIYCSKMAGLLQNPTPVTTYFDAYMHADPHNPSTQTGTESTQHLSSYPYPLLESYNLRHGLYTANSQQKSYSVPPAQTQPSLAYQFDQTLRSGNHANSSSSSSSTTMFNSTLYPQDYALWPQVQDVDITGYSDTTSSEQPAMSAFSVSSPSSTHSSVFSSPSSPTTIEAQRQNTSPNPSEQNNNSSLPPPRRKRRTRAHYQRHLVNERNYRERLNDKIDHLRTLLANTKCGEEEDIEDDAQLNKGETLSRAIAYIEGTNTEIQQLKDTIATLQSRISTLEQED